MSGPDLLVAGSIAIDSLRGGLVTDRLGGSALYFALAASLVRPVAMVAPVGTDAEARVAGLLARRGGAVDVGGVERVEAPTYRWFADADHGRNVDLGSRDTIYDHWRPRVPERFGGWAFVGSMRPDRQLEATAGLAGAELLAADAMRSYVASAPAQVRELLERCDWYFANEEELAALAAGSPQDFRRRHRLAGLVVKHGPGGVTVYTGGGELHHPALTEPAAVETTGAGDSLAGGLLARWLELGGGEAALPEAVRWGVAAATIAVSGIGTDALAAATAADLERLATRA